MKTIPILATIAFVALCGSITYSCQHSRGEYYATVHDCIAKGAMWLPIQEGDGTGPNTGACVYVKGAER